MSTPIFGITVAQPWAWSVAIGNAPCINRAHRPEQDLVGAYLAIHAPRERDWLEDEKRQERGHSELDSAAFIAQRCGVSVPPEAQLVRGAIIAVAKCTRITTIASDAETLKGSRSLWARGPVVLWLEDVLAIEPVPYPNGWSQPWQLEPAVLQALRVEWRAAAMAKGLPRTPCPCGVTSAWCQQCGACQAPGHPKCPHYRRAA